jgi:hypothetical protein
MSDFEPAASVVHWIFSGLQAVVLFLGGFVLKGFRDDHNALTARHEALALSLPETYARRDDMKEGFAELRRQQEQMNAKLDRLLERS